MDSISNWYYSLSPAGQLTLWSVVKIMIVVGVVQGLVAYSVLAERKISAWIQDRVGPNRCAPPFAKYIPVVGPALIRLGMFQPLADGLKFLLKEDFTPAGVRKVYFWLAPALAVIPS
ncbi:MAG TPA: NADH-quinone oxidoreductase subunit H, partial [Verrucomicrobiae bacterium]|nr:NADH-quinone oxidoreductase subunit H [Verrucomicrobiae bacterium]